MTALQHLRIGTKLLAAISIVVIGALCIALIAWRSTHALAERIEIVTTRNAVDVQKALRWKEAITGAIGNARLVLTSRLESTRTQARQELADAAAEVGKMTNEFKASLSGAELEQVDSILARRAEYITIRTQAFAMADRGEDVSAMVTGKLEPATRGYQQAVLQFQALLEDNFARARA